MFPKRPYLVIPKLIKQPTWGGDYILQTKRWDTKPELAGVKIGQSYELFGQSKFRLDLTTTEDEKFIPEVGYADKDETDSFPLQPGTQYDGLSAITAQPVPILIKFTQALGNSFQLHVPPGTVTGRWKPKPETWFYFEDGKATCGLVANVDVSRYKQCCEEISAKMTQLSSQIVAGTISIEAGVSQARDFITSQNPWQYVNTIHPKKDAVVDMSSGGIHHSWEEDRQSYPLGNVLYEVQLDAMDPVSTIRCFDQGKIKSDGSIRPIQIDDYFEHLDTTPAHNTPDRNVTYPTGNTLCSTPYYSLERLTVTEPLHAHTTKSFVHFFVRSGVLKVAAADGSVTVGTGHSCFVPQEVGDYQLESVGSACTVLKTFI